MWSKKFSKVYANITKEEIWSAWVDVNNWPKWDTELEYCDLIGQFIEGEKFILKPIGGPKVKITLSEVCVNQKFTNYCTFIGATMCDSHELIDEPNGLRIINIITVKGPLAFIWKHLVAKKVAQAVTVQTDNLVKYARENNA